MDTRIQIAIITGTFSLIGIIITAYLNYLSKIKEIESKEKENGVENKQNRKKTPILIIFLLLLLLGSVIFLIINSTKKDTTNISENAQKLPKLFGDWVTTECWGNNFENGTLTLYSVEKNTKIDSIYGFSTNHLNEKSDLYGYYDKTTRSANGKWNNQQRSNGDFKFQFTSAKFSGTYNNTKCWNGIRFDYSYTHLINISHQPPVISLRTRELSQNEYIELNAGNKDRLNSMTLIGELKQGDSIKVVKISNKSYEILCKFKGCLYRGFIPKSFDNQPTIDPIANK